MYLLLDGTTLTLKGHPLNENDKRKFLSFWYRLNGASIIYRGVDGIYLRERYNTDSGDVKLLSDLLFLYGDKGEDFCKKFSVDYDINNTERICFVSIFKTLKDSFLKRDSNNSSVQRKMPSFVCDNHIAVEEILSFNEDIWWEKIKELPEEVKIAIKDYYISFLHTIRKAGYGNYSYFLSTTRKERVAAFFRNNDIENGAIIVGWTNNKNIKCEDSLGLKEIVSSYGFPTFETVVFPEQHEITYKCGLLPHFIIGYYYQDSFEINPWVLKISDMSKVRKEGLPVDQKPFLKLLSKTNFKSYYSVCDCFYWQQSI